MPFTNNMRLVEGLGKLDIENRALFPSIVPCGVSLSMKPGVPDDDVGVALLNDVVDSGIEIGHGRS
jgi:hypothetical protein